MDLDTQLPKNWQELLLVKNTIGSYTGATRLQEDQEFYDQYQSMISRDTLMQIVRNMMHGEEIALVKNSFPYSRILQHLPSVKHYLIWSVKGRVEKEMISQLVKEKFPSQEWYSFESLAHRKSVPEIWHAHIFINA